MAAEPILAERTENPTTGWSSERRAWLRLARSRGVGASLFCRLIERFGKEPEELSRRLGSFADQRSLTIPDCGHNLQHDQPELVARAIEEFLERD